MRVGFDMDGTITAYPGVMANLMMMFGSENCYIITARHPGGLDSTRKQLLELGITDDMYTELFYYPEVYDYHDLRKPNSEGLWQKLIDFKVSTCKRLGVTLMIEDDSKYKQPLEDSGVKVLLVKQGEYNGYTNRALIG